MDNRERLQREAYNSLYYVFSCIDFSGSHWDALFRFSFHFMNHLIDARVHQVVVIWQICFLVLLEVHSVIIDQYSIRKNHWKIRIEIILKIFTGFLHIEFIINLLWNILFIVIVIYYSYPIVLPRMTSAWQDNTSAIISSLKKSFGHLHLRPCVSSSCLAWGQRSCECFLPFLCTLCWKIKRDELLIFHLNSNAHHASIASNLRSSGCGVKILLMSIKWDWNNEVETMDLQNRFEY